MFEYYGLILGKAPDAFFYVGTELPVGESTGTLVPYPIGTDGVLVEYDGSVDVIITLPENINAADVKWLSVWCRQYAVNFGDITFPGREIEEPTEGKLLFNPGGS